MFPKIKLRNVDLKKYAKAEISVSCVTQDAVPRVHPYKVKNNKRVRSYFAQSHSDHSHIYSPSEKGLKLL